MRFPQYFSEINNIPQLNISINNIQLFFQVQCGAAGEVADGDAAGGAAHDDAHLLEFVELFHVLLREAEQHDALHRRAGEVSFNPFRFR